MLVTHKSKSYLWKCLKKNQIKTFLIGRLKVKEIKDLVNMAIFNEVRNKY